MDSRPKELLSPEELIQWSRERLQLVHELKKALDMPDKIKSAQIVYTRVATPFGRLFLARESKFRQSVQTKLAEFYIDGILEARTLHRHIFRHDFTVDTCLAAPTSGTVSLPRRMKCSAIFKEICEEYN
jgi:hypothetical protein